jgi:GTPase SAR1 family protein
MARVKMVMLGDAAVGKTNIFNAILTREEFNRAEAPTIGVACQPWPKGPESA